MAVLIKKIGHKMILKTNMALSDFKKLKENLTKIDCENWREIFENAGTSDFEVENYRFILRSDIDQIQQIELKSDLHILGCFNSWFIADILDIDVEVIESMQESESFESISKLIISLDKIEELQKEYSSMDGYGHHFAHYDHNEHEITINGFDYIAFKIN